MAAKQGMKDISFHPVTDQAQPVLQYVNGPLTGKGSGLLTPVTQTFGGTTQGSITQSAQAAGSAMHLGSSTLTPVGGSNSISSAPAGSSLSGGAFAALEGSGGGASGGGSGAQGTGAQGTGAQGMGAQGMAAAQAMMSSAPGAHGSAAAMAGSALGNPALSQAASSGSGAAAAAASAGGAGLSSLPGITPGMKPAAPQFTPLPTIPAMPRLSDVLGRLGAMVGIPGGGASPGASDALSGAGGSGATAQPASQFGGSAPADPTEAEFD